MGLFDKLFAPKPEAQAPPAAVNGAKNGKVLHLRSALVQAYNDQVSKLASMPPVSSFVEAHLRDEELTTRVLEAAEERMKKMLDDGQPLRVSYREHETLLIHVDVLPVKSKEASEWFTKEHGSYLSFQSKIVDDPGFRNDGYKVFLHVVFGVEKRQADGLFFAWSTIGLMPVWEPNLTEWVCPRVCCNEDDRAILGF
ncbi:MAG: hypothetical protein ACYTG2_00770 [Planctomycetota bacterium]